MRKREELKILKYLFLFGKFHKEKYIRNMSSQFSTENIFIQKKLKSHKIIKQST